MNDFLLSLGTNPRARSLIGALKLPIPLPEPLARARGPWEPRPFEGDTIILGGAGSSTLLPALAGALAEAGAALTVDDATRVVALRSAGEAHARPVRADEGSDKVHALVFDATGIDSIDQLRTLFTFFQPRVGRLARSRRVVVIGREPAADVSPATNAARAALVGFTKSTAKEIGRRGGTANCVLIGAGGDARVAPAVRWLLEHRSAFVTAQPLTVTGRAAGGRTALFVRPLDGQVALVTGAARGIGRATAQALAAEGAKVFCVDRAEDSADVSELAQSIGGVALLADVTASDTPAKIALALGARGVDIVVHNAGITRDKTLGRMSPEAWDAVLGVNLAAIVRITDALLPRALRDNGRIVCLSSVSGIAGNVGQTNYAASKAALVGYVDALATQLGPRGITANAIAPGFIETRMTATIPLMIREGGRRLAALGQGGLPEDVAQAITFLSTPGAQGITGRTLRVCGGALIGA